jgi:hypothetical protein
MSKHGMRIVSRQRQAGVSLFGAVIVMIFLALLFLIGLKVVPTVVEFRAIQKQVQGAAASAKTIEEARAAFDRTASVADIESISGKDLDVERTGDGVSISFAYSKKIPLAGPVSLLIDYAGHSDRGS